MNYKAIKNNKLYNLKNGKLTYDRDTEDLRNKAKDLANPSY